MSKYIAILDSGIGGLTVLHALRSFLPHENFIYVADSANIPYGNKSKDEIISLSRRLIEWLNTQPVKLIVLACNTSDTNALEILRQISNIPIIGISRAIIKMLHEDQFTEANVTYILTTVSTYNSLVFQSTNVKVVPCLEFASLIEKLPINSTVLRNRILDCLHLYIRVPFSEIKKLIYGCTHYPLIDNIIKEAITEAEIIDPSFYLADMVKNCLPLHSATLKGELKYYVTGNIDVFYSKLQEISMLYDDDNYLLAYPQRLYFKLGN